MGADIRLHAMTVFSLNVTEASLKPLNVVFTLDNTGLFLIGSKNSRLR